MKKDPMHRGYIGLVNEARVEKTQRKNDQIGFVIEGVEWHKN